MDFILNEKLHSFRFKNYRFLPKISITIYDDSDICDLLNSEKVKPVGVITKKLDLPIQEKKAKEGQLKIGILRVGGLGDTLQLGAHACAVKRKFPDCFLTVYVRDKISAEIMEYNKYVDKIYQVGVASWDSIVALHSKNHDIFYDFRYAVKVIFNTKLYPEYRTQTEKMFTEYEKIYKDFCKSNYKIENYGINLIDFSNKVACLEGNCNDLTFDLKDNGSSYARSLVGQKYVTLHVSNGQYRVTKSWGIERWEKVVEYLISLGYTVVQLGDNGGEQLIQGCMGLMGITTLHETAWVLYGAQFHLDTEGGLVHLAKAVKTPAVVIFGATPVECFGYKDNINLRINECKPCWYKTEDWYLKCPDGHEIPKCLDLITVDMVKESINKLDEKYKEKRVILNDTNNPFVSIIIPVYNQLKYLAITINSILNFTKENFEIIVVDNGSGSDVKEYLKTFNQSKIIKVITNEKNLGFSKANNQGVKIAQGKYICFLNSDVKVGENWLKMLIDNICDDKVGMVGVSGGRLDTECRCTGITRDNNSRYDYLEGWCLLISKKIFEGIGCFDENFTPAFSEDADLSFRLRREGFKTKIVVGVNIIHYGNKTVFSQQDFDVTKVSKENSLKLKEKLKIKNRGEQNK